MNCIANMVKDSQILERNARRNRDPYTKAGGVIARTKQDYTKLPYETKLYLIEGEGINAEALPAGYIYVTRKAANDLDKEAATRAGTRNGAYRQAPHQRTNPATTGGYRAGDANAEEYSGKRWMQGLNKVVSAQRVIESFNGIFAQYDHSKELQSDACSIGGMVRASGADPLKAREEYLRKRGTQETAEKAEHKHKNLTEHPDDKARDQFFRTAYQHHRQKKRWHVQRRRRNAKVKRQWQ